MKKTAHSHHDGTPGNQGGRGQGIAERKSKRENALRPSSPASSISLSPYPTIFLFIALGGVLLFAAWLRWRYLVQVQPYPDEFVTLLAVKMILEKGAPVLPSGLFYEHGLLFSYAGAAASALFGFSRDVVRMTSLLFGLLTIWLVWYVGRRWYSPGAGLMAATLLAAFPTAVLWSGRARMYALLQAWVLLTLYFAYTGALGNRSSGSQDGAGLSRRLSLLCYLGAALTHFVAISLIPSLILAMALVGWLAARQRGKRAWFRSRQAWLEAAGLIAVVLIAFLVKRAGQPKGITPLEASSVGAMSGIAQVAAIYTGLSFDLGESWRALSLFFIAREAILPTALALLATGWAVANLLRQRLAARDLPTFFLALILAVTTLEMFFFVSPERRDDKYLFMLQPALFLLAADGLSRIGGRISTITSQTPNSRTPISNLRALVSTCVACLALIAYTWPYTSALLARTGADYDSAFGYVRDHWQEGDAILSGTPAAAAIYLGRSDYYAMQGHNYAYRILEKDGQLVERWLGSPWIATAEQLNATLSQPGRIWLVLERWGLLVQYFDREFMQQILAQAEFVREDNGVIVLRSLPNPQPISLEPAVSQEAVFGTSEAWRVKLLGYTMEPSPPQTGQPVRLTLYWQSLATMDSDYRVLVHVRDAEGGNVLVADHAPLGSIYPTTLWQPGEIIRETVTFTLPSALPAGTYTLLTGMYQSDTLERLPVAGDASGEATVLLSRMTLQPTP